MTARRTGFLLIGLLIVVSFFLGMMLCFAMNRKKNKDMEQLSVRLNKTERLEPDIGDSMRDLQMDMAKLWFAQKYHNHALALYELKEMEETVEDIDILKPVVNGVNVAGVMDGMKNSQLADMKRALLKHDDASFYRQYGQTLATCNECHRTSGFGFNRITIPQNPPVSNQDWAPEKEASKP